MLSYTVLAVALSFVVSFFSFFFTVRVFCPEDNEYHVVAGSAAFWALVALIAYLTSGWSSAIAGAAGGVVAFIVMGPGDVVYTWGRAFVRFSNSRAIVWMTPVAFVSRFIGCKLKDAQIPLNQYFNLDNWSKRKN